MAGLLGMNEPDPLTLGLLGFSQAISTPRSRGGGVAAALGAFPMGQMQAAEMQRARQQDAMRQQLMQAQIGNYASEAKAREAQAAKLAQELERAARQRQEQERILATIAPQPGFRDASIAAGGTARAGYVPPSTRVQITPQVAAAWVAAGGDLETLRKLAESGNFGRDEVARVLERRGTDGRPEQIRESKYGDPIGAPVPKPYETTFLNTGGAQTGIDPYTGLGTGNNFVMTQSPDSVASNAVAWANNDVARQRLQLDREAPRGVPLDTAQGPILIDPRSGAGTPVTIGGQRVPPKPQPVTESNSNSFLFANRALAADQIIGQLGDRPSVAGASLQAGLGGVPLIGGSLEAGANFVLSGDTQKYVQAKRDFINAVLRKESGAVIGPDEFKNADKQYFPQPGDSPAVMQQKAENRQRAIQGLASGAGPLAPRIGESSDNDPLGLRK